MKIKHKTSPIKVFVPVEFTITIESQDELIELWHRFNISPWHIRKQNNLARDFNNNTNELWSILDKITNDRNIRLYEE